MDIQVESSTGGKDFAIVGAAQNASYKYDPYWDHPEPPIPPSSIFVLLYCSYPSQTGTHQRLHASYHPLEKNVSWPLTMHLSTGAQDTATITLTWEIVQGESVYHPRLKTPDSTVDMHKSSRYVRHNVSSGIHTWEIVVGQPSANNTSGLSLLCFIGAIGVISLVIFFRKKGTTMLLITGTVTVIFLVFLMTPAPHTNAEMSDPAGRYPLHLQVSSALGSDNATLGIAGNATAAFDRFWDAPQPPSPPSPQYVQAYFYYPGHQQDLRMLTRSYHNVSVNTSWTFIINVNLGGLGGENVTVSWDPMNLDEWPDLYTIRLETPDGWLDMRELSSYTYEGLSGYNFFDITAVANDTTPPAITDIMASPSPTHDRQVNISCNVTDDLPVKKATANISYPSGDSITLTLKKINNIPRYYTNYSYPDTGTYQYFIWSRDIAGNANVSALHTFTVLNNPPQTPASPSGPASGSTGTHYVFSASTTDLDGDRIRYGFDWNNDQAIDEWTGFHQPGAAASRSHAWNTPGTHSIRVKAEDEQGAQSSWSPTKTLTISSPSNLPPSVAITSPTEDETVSGNVTIQGDASDSDGSVQRVDLRIDHKEWRQANGTSSWSFSWDTLVVDNGNHTLYARSYDGQDHSDISSIHVTVFNNHQPIIAIVSPTDGAEIKGIVTINGTVQDKDGNDTLQKVEITIGDNDWKTLNATAEWSYTWDTKKYENGEYEVQARAYDGWEYGDISIHVTVNNKRETPGFGIGLLLAAVIAFMIVQKKP